MKTITRWLVRMYPARWRARYGDELSTLIQDSPARLSSLFNVAIAAFRMHMLSANVWVVAVILATVGGCAGLALTYLLLERFVVTVELPAMHHQWLRGKEVKRISPGHITNGGIRLDITFKNATFPRPVSFFGPSDGGIKLELPAASRLEARTLTHSIPDHLILWEDSESHDVAVFVPANARFTTIRFGANRLLFSTAGFAVGLMFAVAIGIARGTGSPV